MPTPPSGGISGADLMRQFLPTSPYNVHLGIRITTIEPGMAQLALPFTEALVTNGTIMHGGAIASLIDTAAAVAAWSDAAVPEKIRGVTISLMVTYLAMASQEDL